MAEWSKAVVSGTIHYLARVQIPLASIPFFFESCSILSPQILRVIHKGTELKFYSLHSLIIILIRRMWKH